MSANVEQIPPGSRLELYISPSCPYCTAAMAHYDATGQSYVVHDAQNDLNERTRMFAYTNNDPTVPAIIIDGNYIQSGWGNPQEAERSTKERRSPLPPSSK